MTKHELKQRHISLMQKKFHNHTNIKCLQRCSKDVIKHKVSNKDANRHPSNLSPKEEVIYHWNVYQRHKIAQLCIKYYFLQALHIYFLSFGRLWSLAVLSPLHQHSEDTNMKTQFDMRELNFHIEGLWNSRVHMYLWNPSKAQNRN